MYAAKNRLLIIVAVLALLVAVIYGAVTFFPLNMLPVQPKPEQPPQKAYDYYLIIDTESGRTLMYVPLTVNVGDEVISDDNKRYQVVRVEENRAYARFVENVDLEKYKPKK